MAAVNAFSKCFCDTEDLEPAFALGCLKSRKTLGFRIVVSECVEGLILVDSNRVRRGLVSHLRQLGSLESLASTNFLLHFPPRSFHLRGSGCRDLG